MGVASAFKLPTPNLANALKEFFRGLARFDAIPVEPDSKLFTLAG